MRGRIWITLIIAIVFVGITAKAVHKRALEQGDWARVTESGASRVVDVTRPQPSTDTSELVLPANMQAFQETPIYARTNGYVKRWYTEMGTQVKAGQLLAEIDTPEVDQELLQAQAAEAQAIADRDLAEKTHIRWQTLLKTHFVSQQEADQYGAQLQAREADVRAARANVRRLHSLQAFKAVRAPFDGVVTARNIDVGTLIASGNSQALFRVAQARTLRVYVQVPQAYGPAVQVGLDASLEIPEYPGRHFAGKVTTTSGAIDPATRTLNTEIQVPNPQGELLPGSFGTVHFHLAQTRAALIIPSTTLLFRGEGAQVATINEQGKVKLKAVKLGRDLGNSLEVLEGLNAEDRIVLNPPDSLGDAEAVEVLKEEVGH